MRVITSGTQRSHYRRVVKRSFIVTKTIIIIPVYRYIYIRCPVKSAVCTNTLPPSCINLYTISLCSLWSSASGGREVRHVDRGMAGKYPEENGIKFIVEINYSTKRKSSRPMVMVAFSPSYRYLSVRGGDGVQRAMHNEQMECWVLLLFRFRVLESNFNEIQTE